MSKGLPGAPVSLALVGGGATQPGLIGLFANNPVAANLLMAVLLIGGLLQAVGLSAQLFPTVDPGIVNVTVAYPGATPTEVEEGITRRVEEAVLGIEGVDRVVSKASENVGVVTVELKDGTDAEKARSDVEMAVNRLSAFPPVDAEEPDVVLAQTVSDVITLSVSSELGEQHLKSSARWLEEKLLALPTVSMVSLMGVRGSEVAIEVSEAALRRYNLSMSEIADAVRASSINLSSGELRTASGDLLLRTSLKRDRGESFGDIVLRSDDDGALLFLRDVAEIRDGFADEVLINEVDDRPSAFVRVQKSESEDALTIASDVRALLGELQPPAGAAVEVWEDQTEVLEDRLDLMVRNGVLGFALVFLFLVLMLDLRLALWVAMGVPISFLGAFLLLEQFGVNINMMSLFALIIVLGVVVDDAVVVGENIVAEQEAGKRGVAAALAGVRGVFAPVTVGVLTTMAAFAPLLLAGGTFGQIMGVVPVVVIAVLTISLIEVFLILPSHLAHPGRWSRWPLDVVQNRVGAVVLKVRDGLVLPAVRQAVRWRYLTALGGLVFLVGAFSLVGSGAVRFIFFPALEADFVRAEVEFPIGTPFATTKAAAMRIEAAARAVNDELGGQAFRSVNTTIGGRVTMGDGPGSSSSAETAPHIATIQVQLNGEPLRSTPTQEIKRLWRERVGAVVGAEKVTFVGDFFRGGSSIAFELSHRNDATLESASEWLKDRMAAQPALEEVQDSAGAGKRQFDIELTAAGKAAGLTPADVARQLRQRFFGEEVQRIQRGREEMKVMVRYPLAERRSTQDLFGARIRLGDGRVAPLSAVARVEESRGYSQIDRIDGRRVVTVSAEVDTSVRTPGEANEALRLDVLPEMQRTFPDLLIAEGGFSRDQSEDLASLGRTALIAMLVIYALIAAQLKSYTQPLIVLAGVPFGAAGALIGHYVLGFDLSFISIFGMIALAGVVVNDSLVLMDRYNTVRSTTDLSPQDAVAQASRRRFRAIFLTTVTTALGLTPMLFETSIQAQFLIPMAVSLATGIVFASFIILFLMPALVVIQEDLFSKVRRDAAESAAA